MLCWLRLLRVQQNISSKPKTSNINRSESYKERIHHKVKIYLMTKSFLYLKVILINIQYYDEKYYFLLIIWHSLNLAIIFNDTFSLQRQVREKRKTSDPNLSKTKWVHCLLLKKYFRPTLISKNNVSCMSNLSEEIKRW